ncbi:DUF1365 domain-containing protein [Prauserella cavernicola]|uniref:DUF1365 domain-containing protein n=1 Tax=Prauserella cavernicola TaxID=2800127 RepID=A0A934QWJ8_9PSEU|nr:DUF1365 domain-containing protein [Prauserella cavernicola]MBK1787758.1 DUF1365 domain-containing protein [Prauserella cavernicola]
MSVPALYDTVVTHTRHDDEPRTFQHRLYTWLVDADHLPALPRWLRPFARFDARDHLGHDGEPLRAELDRWLASQGVNLEGGRVLMLAHARVLGYVFNPLTVYWCEGPDGEQACVVAEVHNTYGEAHRYLLRPGDDDSDSTDKRFYVSPFLPDHGRYRMRLPRPGERLTVHIELRGENGRLLTATMSGRRRPATRRELVRLLLRRPLVPQRVSLLIRKHGIALWLRRVPIVPRRPATSGTPRAKGR